LEQRVDGSTFIVLDLGGGTFDVSILEIFEGVMQVHASAGDNHLGGEDFLDALVSKFILDSGLRRNNLSKNELAQLIHKLERAKREISTSKEASIEIVINEKNIKWSIDESAFEHTCESLITKIRQPVERAIRDAKLNPSQLAEVVLVGGASRMPMVSRLAARMLGKLPLRHVDPDRAIAMGACIAAGMKARNAALEEIVMTDVCPYTLGVEISRRLDNGQVSSGHFSPIIERNCTVPISHSETFSPMHTGQRQLALIVYQGESPLVANNVCLGKLEINFPARLKDDEKNVDVRFTYDVNGVLQVEATVISTKEKHEIILKNDGGALTEEEIKARFKDLESIKIHPREDQENVALIARAERVYAELLGAQRDQVQQWLILFMQEIEKQDRRSIEKHRIEFSNALDAVEEGMRW
jgi:molecular chaperone HscC